jgi:hypothetical protein
MEHKENFEASSGSSAGHAPNRSTGGNIREPTDVLHGPPPGRWQRASRMRPELIADASTLGRLGSGTENLIEQLVALRNRAGECTRRSKNSCGPEGSALVNVQQSQPVLDVWTLLRGTPAASAGHGFMPSARSETKLICCGTFSLAWMCSSTCHSDTIDPFLEAARNCS